MAITAPSSGSAVGPDPKSFEGCEKFYSFSTGEATTCIGLAFDVDDCCSKEDVKIPYGVSDKLKSHLPANVARDEKLIEIL